jgi:rfaE bifunctional protein kinase chain/domain
MPMTDERQSLIPKLAEQRVIVAGDLILDEYLTGRATRMSREAPLPVLEFESRRHIPGGAANPAANIAALGAQVVQVGVVGADDAADQLRVALMKRGVPTDTLVHDPSRPTTVKMRLMAHMGLRFPQQVARLDTLSRAPISESVAAQVADTIRAQLPLVGALLLSDYRCGMLTSALVTDLREAARAAGVLLTADAQGEFDKYTGFGLVKCNANEAAEHLSEVLNTDSDFADAARTLCDELALTVGMVVTRGGEGATLALSDGTVHHCPAPSVTDVFDTVGAGDTAVAVMTLALCAGAPPPAAVTLANYASGLVVRKVGNYTPSPSELAWALANWDTE